MLERLRQKKGAGTNKRGAATGDSSEEEEDMEEAAVEVENDPSQRRVRIGDTSFVLQAYDPYAIDFTPPHYTDTLLMTLLLTVSGTPLMVSWPEIMIMMMTKMRETSKASWWQMMLWRWRARPPRWRRAPST